jgi:hypothetical protein
VELFQFPLDLFLSPVNNGVVLSAGGAVLVVGGAFLAAR